ncbi:MAG: serine hydrolase domain-containing protein [Ktedonobacteraceae bacterium]
MDITELKKQESIMQIEAYIQAKMHDLHLPGLSLAIVQNDQVIYQRGFGVADTTGRPVTPQTPFVLGSLSKSFTALAIMQLVEAGKIDLDAPVQRYLPWFRVADPDASAHITIRHLLIHTSGLSLYTGRQLLGRRVSSTREQTVRLLKRVKLAHEPGVAFDYCNTNYLILSFIIEIVAEESYERYIERHIFRLLHMHHSHVSEQEALRDGPATGYRWWFGWPRPTRAPYLTDALGAAFLISSAEDMARWLVAHLNGGSVDGASVLSTAGIEELHRPQVPTNKAGSIAAMGWRVEQLGSGRIVRHGGEVSNYRADMVLVPGRKLGVVVLQNCNNGVVAQLGLDQIALDVVRLLLGHAPSKRAITFQSFSLLVRLVVILVSALHLWSLVRLIQRPARSGPGSTLALISEVAAPLLTIWGVPRSVDGPWSLLRWYVPDLSAWLSVMGSLSLGKILLRIAHLFFATEKKNKQRDLVAAAQNGC